MTTPDALDDYKLFETWAAANDKFDGLYNPFSRPDKLYSHGRVQDSFEAFQAGRASIQPAIAPWLPIETAPKDAYIYVQQAAVYRWLPYKETSQEFKRGTKGRWQKHTGYRFDNAELEGVGWVLVDATPPQKESS